MEITYKKSFVKQVQKLDPDLQQEVYEKIDLFAQDFKHPMLKTHKLKGALAGFWSFSINYSYRIIFEIYKNEIIFLEIGNHDLYR